MMLVKDIFSAAGYKMRRRVEAKSIYEFMDPLKKLAEEIIYELSSAKEVQLETIDIKNVDNYLYSSAINTAILSVLIGWEAGLTNEMIQHVFMGAIFHDIGMALIDSGITYKKGALTREEKIEVIMHPKKGYEYLKGQAFFKCIC